MSNTQVTEARELTQENWPTPGRSLPQEYYTSEAIYRRDIEMYGRSQWLFVDHVSRLADAGDWFTYRFGNESIIIVRDDNDEINAFYNVCRHRGSVICTTDSGSNKLLTCGYHAWSYDLRGELKQPRFMPADFDRTENSLAKCHIRVSDGFIFVNFAKDTPPDFEAMIGDLRPYLDLHSFETAKVAIRKRWVVEANWKLNVENFYECYHCRSAHATYTGVHDSMKMIAFGAGPGSSDGQIGSKYEVLLGKWEQETQAKGLFTGMFSDDINSPFFRSASRLPIKDGCLTETLDGTPASTLMGKFREFDGGQTAFSFNPTGVIHGNNDFAMSFRYTPLGALKTELEVLWYVDKDAVEGKDYELDKISAVWSVTLDEDKTITQDNQTGVLSSAYTPGVYSTQESRVADFTQWYLHRTRDYLDQVNATLG